VQAPEAVARALVALAERPRRERHVPRAARLGVALHAAFPRSIERILFDALSRWHFGSEPQPSTRGNLDQPQRPGGDIRGHRPPRVSFVGLVWYAARRFPVVTGELALHALASRFGARFRSLPAAARPGSDGEHHGRRSDGHPRQLRRTARG
jgi:hypothetical protein